jgi:endonuclease/exonuclease/phosphatase (EEP) superfamily protein YafD
MKVIYLNAWHATLRAPLMDFIKTQMVDTDIFCFQESSTDFQAMCRAVLPEFHELSARKFVTENDNFFQTTYVRSTAQIVSSGTILEDVADVGLGQYVQLKDSDTSLYVCNFHGMSRPIDKGDSPGRLLQTQGLVEFFKTKTGVKVIGGDFNVFPQNSSLQLFEASGYRDLIKEHRITNTRNHFIWDRYPENPRQYFSDYIFASNGIREQTFTVPNIEVSDHLPLIFEFSVQASSLARKDPTEDLISV